MLNKHVCLLTRLYGGTQLNKKIHKKAATLGRFGHWTFIRDRNILVFFFIQLCHVMCSITITLYTFISCISKWSYIPHTSSCSLLHTLRSSWKATPLRVTVIGLPRLSTGPVCSDQVSEKIPALEDLKVKGNSVLCPGRSTPAHLM